MICAECNLEAFGTALGWRCYRYGENDEDDQLVFYCAFCALREFGPRPPRPTEQSD